MLRGLLLALCGLALLAPAAVAADDEVFVDPGSPSGKEYALPVDRARQEAAGETKGAKGSNGKAATPLFGEGVEAASGQSTTAKRSGSGAAATRDDANAAAGATAGGPTREAAPKTLKAGRRARRGHRRRRDHRRRERRRAPARRRDRRAAAPPRGALRLTPRLSPARLS